MKKKNLIKLITVVLAVFPVMALTGCEEAESGSLKLSTEALSDSAYTDEEINAYVKEYMKDSAYYYMITNVDAAADREQWGSFYYEEERFVDEIKGTTMYRYTLTGEDITLSKNHLYLFQYFDDCAYGMSESNLSEAFQTFFGFSITSLDAAVKGFFAPNEYTDNEDYQDGIQKALAEKFLTTFQDISQDYTDDNARYFYCIPRSNITLNKRSLTFTTEESLTSTPGILCFAYTILEAPDIVAPSFDTTDYYIPVNVDNPLSVSEILSQIHASDDVDGDISSKVELVSTTYNPYSLVLGNHEFIVAVSDTALNETQATFYITVYDIVKPIISGTNSYTVSYDVPLTLDEIKSALAITDNFSTGLTLNVVSDSYTGNETELGVHTVIFNTVDEAGNTSDNYPVSITVFDKKAPVITAPIEFTVNSTAVITLEDIKSKISIVDRHDGNITDYTITGFDAYLSDTTKVKNYTLEISCMDSSGNLAKFPSVLKVLDKNAPELWVYSDFVIVLPKGQAITEEDIISYLSQIGEIDAAQVKSVNFDVDNETKGNYEVVVLMLDNTEYKATIAVEEYEEPFNFWEASWDLYIQNWKDFSKWNYSHWLTLILVVFLVIGAIVANRKKRK